MVFTSWAKAPKTETASTAVTAIARIKLFMRYSGRRSCVLERHDDLAEVLVGLHVREGLPDIVKCEHLVDRQLQLAGFHRPPDILSDFVKDGADFIHRAAAEGDTDVIDSPRRMQVEVEIGVCPAEPPDIDDAALDPDRLQIL